MSHATLSYRSLDEWITRGVIPFSVYSSEVFNDAVDTVIASLDDSVDLLGFGEALHGGEDVLVIRNRLFQHLVERHGYTGIAIESSFPRARIVNEYVASCGPASYEAVQDTGFGQAFGGLEANRELVEWMRVYNADPSHSVKLQFYGFDIPTGTIGIASPRQVLHFVLDYLASNVNSGSQSQSQERSERIDALLGQDADWENPAAIMDSTKSIGLSPAATALRIEVEELISELRVRRLDLAAKSREPQYSEALHYASVARQLLNFHATMARELDYAERLSIRDVLMADNLAYIVSRERGRGKVLAFAHNSHLKRGKAHWQMGTDLHTWWSAGAYLDAMLGTRYAVIGSAIGVSDDNGIGQPEAGTLEALLVSAQGPARFIPTHKGERLPVDQVAALPTRSGSTKNPSYFALTPQNLAEFDWLVVLDSTSYNKGGPSLEAWDANTE